jgi:hypothetical protein
MIFSEVLAAVDRELRSRSVPFAIAGGVALAVHGIQRTTLDLDLVTDGGCRFRVHEAMAALGYVPSRDLPGLCQYEHPNPRYGHVDFLFVPAATWLEMSRMLGRYEGWAGLAVDVVHPEHLIAMKAFAIHCDPGRKDRDLPDILRLRELPGVDPERADGYLARWGLKRELRSDDE